MAQRALLEKVGEFYLFKTVRKLWIIVDNQNRYLWGHAKLQVKLKLKLLVGTPCVKEFEVTFNEMLLPQQLYLLRIKTSQGYYFKKLAVE